MSKDDIMRRYRQPMYRTDVDEFCQTSEARGKVLCVEDENPFCGDSLRMVIRVNDCGNITAAGYDGYGCSLCIASAEWLLESVIGGPIQESERSFEEICHGLGDVQVSRNRRKCVELSRELMKRMIVQWSEEQSI